ncbi:hypothetical protein IE53DRAFT_391019 [Violaceomyces palustris]|uniref:Uncharacterized protein n=1 Tax=Violaceomyces palustris TaxID=1673888 RepID=A0ACD0NLZ7_9BASI|nr:hypothetical protein IE53DRAFT_391019 [Violaceomyces palustris]
MAVPTASSSSGSVGVEESATKPKLRNPLKLAKVKKGPSPWSVRRDRSLGGEEEGQEGKKRKDRPTFTKSTGTGKKRKNFPESQGLSHLLSLTNSIAEEKEKEYGRREEVNREKARVIREKKRVRREMGAGTGSNQVRVGKGKAKGSDDSNQDEALSEEGEKVHLSSSSNPTKTLGRPPARIKSKAEIKASLKLESRLKTKARREARKRIKSTSEGEEQEGLKQEQEQEQEKGEDQPTESTNLDRPLKGLLKTSSKGPSAKRVTWNLP